MPAMISPNAPYTENIEPATPTVKSWWSSTFRSGPTSDTAAGSLPVAWPVRSVMSTSNWRAVRVPGGSTTSSRVE